MIEVITEFSCLPGQRQRVLDAALALQSAVQDEVGCLGYSPLLDVPASLPEQVLDGEGVVLIEQWQSLKHLHAHLTSPHQLEFESQTAEAVRQVRQRVLTAP